MEVFLEVTHVLFMPVYVCAREREVLRKRNAGTVVYARSTITLESWLQAFISELKILLEIVSDLMLNNSSFFFVM